MPRIAIDYSKTIFYKIVCRDPEIKDCYVGHTTNWVKRKNGHKNTCINALANGHNYIVYQFIREHGGWDNWEMVMIETCECANSIEACKKEREYFDILKPTLNKYTPYLTADETYAKTTERKRKWRTNNKEYFREYHSKNKEK